MTATDDPTHVTMPRDTAFFLDPHAWYRRMRVEAPVWLDPATGQWIAFRHADVRRILIDPATFSSALPPVPGQELFLTSMNNTDDPRHAALRALVQKEFSPRRIAGMALRITEITRDLIDGVVDAGSGTDLVTPFSGALPAIVIAELLGVPAQDRDRFRAWADEIVLFGEPDRMEEAFAAMAAMADYFTQLVEAKLRAPAQDVMTALTAAHDAGALSTEELVDFGLLLLTGGHETTTSMINNTVRCLHEHPDARTQVQADPSLVPALLEEVLRYRSPVQMLLRVATTEVTLGEVTLPAGAAVRYCIGSANRDPEVFTDPEVFDLDRRPTDHVAFGYGLHGCIGNALARLEGRIAITALLERFPRIHVDEQAPLDPIRTPDLHGVKRMHVRF